MKKKTRKIKWYELIEAMDYNLELPISEQIEEYFIKLGCKKLEIENIVFNVNDFINKLCKVELTYIKRGETEALEKWYKLGLPKLEN